MADGDDNTDTLNDLGCLNGEIAVQTDAGWACSTLAEELDNDGDGSMVWADCDDTDEALGAKTLDPDCDGYIEGVDCDNDDPESTHTGIDGDCDGVITADDCDDTSALGSVLGDEACPVSNCGVLLSVTPEMADGSYFIQPAGAVSVHKFYCDLSGTFAEAGSLHLVSFYGAYSARGLAQCGGPEDIDCTPDAAIDGEFRLGALDEPVLFDWRDEDNLSVSSDWLSAYSTALTSVEIGDVRHHAYDADASGDYRIQFQYADGTANSPDNRGSHWGAGSVWTEWTTQGNNMMLGGQHSTAPESPKIPTQIVLHSPGTVSYTHLRAHET